MILRRTKRSKYLKEVLNPKFLNIRRQTKDQVSCLFRSEITEEKYSFVGHDIDKCSATDYENTGNILEHDGTSAYNMNME